MKNHMVTVIASHDPTTSPIHDLGQVTILHFGPCTKKEGDVLADRIQAWIRGGLGGGPAKAFRNLGLRQAEGDVWTICHPIPTAGISGLQKQFGAASDASPGTVSAPPGFVTDLRGVNGG